MSDKKSDKISISDSRELLQYLSELVSKSDLGEVEIEQGDLRIRVVKYTPPISPVMAALPAQATTAVPQLQPSEPAVTKSVAQDEIDLENAVKSPMVGTVYLAPDPEAAPFIAVGDQVKAGQTLLIVEAMKVMNAIPAPRDGVVRRILVQDKEPVEYGHPLVILE